MISLRDYQQQAKDETYQAFSEKINRILLYMTMGSGKTRTSMAMVKEFLQAKLPVSYIVRRRELVKQVSKVMQGFDIDHGVNMANHYRFDPKKLVQVSSVDTLGARKIFPHHADNNTVVFIDEVQDATSNTYKEVISNYEHNKIIGLSGTPFRDNSMFERIVCPITPYELYERGILVKERVYSHSCINADGVRSIKGDYVTSDLEKVSIDSKIVGNIVDTWIARAEGRKTLLFAVSVNHSKIMCEEFLSRGIRAIHIDAGSSETERAEAVEQLLKGEINVICNVDIFSVGFDCPSISCVILARPTQSLIWHLQATARGLRSSDDKSDCIILDHAGNYFRHGFILETRNATLDKPEKKQSKDDEPKLRTCKQCFYIFSAEFQQCPECGFINPPIVRKIKTEDGLLVEMTMTEEQVEEIRKKAFLSDYYKLDHVAKIRKFHHNWTYQQLLKKHGKEKCLKYGARIHFPQEMLK